MAESEGLFIGCVPDGGRRAVNYNPTQYFESYERGGNVVGDMLKICIRDQRVRIFSAWGLSDENAVKRSRSELTILNRIFHKFLVQLQSDLETDAYKDVKVVHMGNPEFLDPRIQKIIDEITLGTRDRQKKIFGLCLGYGSGDEMQRAAELFYRRRQAGEKDVQFTNCLDLPQRGQIPFPPVDIIMRPGTDPLQPYTSGYLLPYQVKGQTQEKYFPQFLPDCDPNIVLEAIADYEERALRKGA